MAACASLTLQAEAQTVPKNGPATRSSSGVSPDPFETVTVIGGGAWGTALAIVSNSATRDTTLWVREREAVEQIRREGINPFLPRIDIPRTIAVTGELRQAVDGAELVVLAVPSQHLRAMARQVEALLPPGVPVVICSKGIETGSGALMSEVVADEMPGRPQAVLSGPSFAEEAAAGQPTAVTVAAAADGGAGLAASGSLAARVALTFGTASFRPYLSDDPVGVEVGGAVKNVLAIACGIAAGRGLGANPRAALIARGLAEMERLALALGGRSETVMGLAGVGDLTLTCSSEQSRNFTFGRTLGAGGTPAEALAGKAVVVEGAVNARAVTALAARLGVEMPICEAVDAIVHRGMPIGPAIGRLLTRPIRAEARALERRVCMPHPRAPGQAGEIRTA